MPDSPRLAPGGMTFGALPLLCRNVAADDTEIAPSVSLTPNTSSSRPPQPPPTMFEVAVCACSVWSECEKRLLGASCPAWYWARVSGRSSGAGVEHDRQLAQGIGGVQLGHRVEQRVLVAGRVGDGRHQPGGRERQPGAQALVGGVPRGVDRHDRVVAVVAAEQVDADQRLVVGDRRGEGLRHEERSRRAEAQAGETEGGEPGAQPQEVATGRCMRMHGDALDSDLGNHDGLDGSGSDWTPHAFTERTTQVVGARRRHRREAQPGDRERLPLIDPVTVRW